MRSASAITLAFGLALAFALPGSSLRLAAAETNDAPRPHALALSLKAEALVDRDGVLLAHLVDASNNVALPTLRLLPAPLANAPLTLARSNVQQLLARPEFGLVVTNWSGADRIRVARRTRSFDETDLKTLLTAALQEKAGDRGEVELRLTRPWTPALVPDEPLTLRILDLPTTGLASLLAVRFELRSSTESVGTWQTVVETRVWREIWIARSALRRGQGVAETDLTRERRDVLPLREPLVDLGAPTEAALEWADGIVAGTPILQRHLRLQPVVHRGQTAEAVLQDGLLNLVVKVEVLDEGAPGQVVRVRNPASRREMRAKVQNEKTVLVGF